MQRGPFSWIVAIAALLAALAIAAEPAPKNLAAVTTVWYHNSHADLIAGRLFLTHTMDGKGERPNLRLASLYTDQVPKNDISRKWAAEYKFPIVPTVRQALTLGDERLAVDGVLLLAEMGTYPESETGQIVYPKRAFFSEIVNVFRASGRVVPVFVDKHLADNWRDAKWLYDTARAEGIPLMAGSSIPVLWRYPPTDVPRDAALKEIVAISYHTLDAYGFHGLEMVQCLAERRAGGETGIRRVRCLVDDAVWQATDQGLFDGRLLQAALDRCQRPGPRGAEMRAKVPHPVLWIMEYADGLRASVLTLNGAVGEWAAAWRDEAGRTDSTLFWTQEERPLAHFTHQLKGIERMMHTGKPAWPVERTLLTSGALDALLISKTRGGLPVETPYLEFSYRSDWNWQQPPPPPTGRPLQEQ